MKSRFNRTLDYDISFIRFIHFYSIYIKGALELKPLIEK